MCPVFLRGCSRALFMCPGGCSCAVAVGKAPEPAVGGQVRPDPEGMVGDPARDFG